MFRETCKNNTRYAPQGILDHTPAPPARWGGRSSPSPPNPPPPEVFEVLKLSLASLDHDRLCQVKHLTHRFQNQLTLDFKIKTHAHTLLEMRCITCAAAHDATQYFLEVSCCATQHTFVCVHACMYNTIVYTCERFASHHHPKALYLFCII